MGPTLPNFLLRGNIDWNEGTLDLESHLGLGEPQVLPVLPTSDCRKEGRNASIDQSGKACKLLIRPRPLIFFLREL